MRWCDGSVRTSRIESEWLSPARAAIGALSVPSTRIVVACEISRPLWGVRAERASAGRRLFASETPLDIVMYETTAQSRRSAKMPPKAIGTQRRHDVRRRNANLPRVPRRLAPGPR